MTPNSPPLPLVFALTPRLGNLNHRFLVSADSPPDEDDVQAVFESRLHADDVLAEKVEVPQKNGRVSNDEWLIVRDTRVRGLAPDRREAIRGQMRDWLAGLTPPPPSEAAAVSECVPFPTIDVIAQRIDSALGAHTFHSPTERSPYLMPIALATCVLLLVGLGLVRMQRPREQEPVNRVDPVPLITVRQSGDQLITHLVDYKASEDEVVQTLREKVIPDLRKGATLLDALNALRPSIESAAHDNYKSNQDALNDKPMLTAVKATLSGTAASAFLAKDNQDRLRDLAPDGFQLLFEKVLAWPAMDVDNERPTYRELDRTLVVASKRAQTCRRADESHIKGAFVYEDAKERLPILLGLFEDETTREPTAFGKLLVSNAQKRPAALGDWLQAAARAYESAGATPHPWLSHEALTMNKRQAAAPESTAPGAAKFYEQLDAFLRDCKNSIRTNQPSHPAETTTQQERPSSPPRSPASLPE